MKKAFYVFIAIYSLTVKAQVCQVGAGIGQGDGIDDLKYEIFYSFNYKLLYTKLNYIYTPKKTDYYKNTSQTALFLGLQTHPHLKLIGHVGLGARAYFPTKNDTYSLYRPQDEPQINLFFNTGASYEFIKHHCIYYNVYIGGVRRLVNKRNYTTTEPSADLMMTIGYVYTFGVHKKSD